MSITKPASTPLGGGSAKTVQFNPDVKSNSVEQLKTTLIKVEELAKLVKHRKNLIEHLDQLESMKAQDVEGKIASIELRDVEGERYTIQNEGLVRVCIDNLKIQMQAKLSAIETQIRW